MTFHDVFHNEQLRNEHLFVNVPTVLGRFSPREVLLWLSDRVIVMGDFNDVGKTVVTEDDPDGNRLIAIPASEVTEIYTEEQLEKFECEVDLNVSVH